MWKDFFNEFNSSIKSPDTEEKLDLLLYRPLGFTIAKISQFFRLTPSMLSLLGLASGVMASFYYLNLKEPDAFLKGSLLFFLSGIFDSSDGQLARLSNQSSKLGLILDGICDSLVIISLYIACSWPFIEKFGLLFLLLVAAGLYLHSCQCAVLDFYHREYLYFGYGKNTDDTYWNPDYREGIEILQNSANVLSKSMNYLRLSWLQKQQALTTRSVSKRLWMKDLLQNLPSHKRETFLKIYRHNNLWLLPYWRLVGVNAHTALMMLFIYFGRFDLYVLCFDLLILNVCLFLVGRLQAKADRKMFFELKNLEEAAQF